MKCPYCGKSIRLFSREMNSFKKQKRCMQCQKPVRAYISFRKVAVWIVPVLMLNIIAKFILINFGISETFISCLIIYGVPAGMLIMLSLELKQVKE